MKKAAIFLASGYEMGEAIITCDLLTRAKISVDFVSITKEYLVKSSHNINIECQKTINQINFDDYQILILPGGNIGVDNLNKNQLLKDNLVKFSQSKDKYLAAICAAPQILGQLNLLDNKKITFYPGCDKGLDKAIKTTEPVVISGNIITGKSIGCAFWFTLKIISTLLNESIADQVKKALEF